MKLKLNYINNYNDLFNLLELLKPNQVWLSWYKKFITTRKNKKIGNETDSHHIIPRFFFASIKMSNSKINTIHLTFREHFIAHLLLLG